MKRSRNFFDSGQPSSIITPSQLPPQASSNDFALGDLTLESKILSPSREKVKILELDSENESFKKLKEFGFRNENITSIANRIKTSNTVVQDLAESLEGLKILKEVGFKPSQISAIFSQAGNNIKLKIGNFLENLDYILKAKDDGLDFKKITILLASTGGRINKRIETLKEYGIATLFNCGFFDPKEIIKKSDESLQQSSQVFGKNFVDKLETLIDLGVFPRRINRIPAEQKISKVEKLANHIEIFKKLTAPIEEGGCNIDKDNINMLADKFIDDVYGLQKNTFLFKIFQKFIEKNFIANSSAIEKIQVGLVMNNFIEKELDLINYGLEDAVLSHLDRKFEGEKINRNFYNIFAINSQANQIRENGNRAFKKRVKDTLATFKDEVEVEAEFEEVEFEKTTPDEPVLIVDANFVRIEQPKLDFEEILFTSIFELSAEGIIFKNQPEKSEVENPKLTTESLIEEIEESKDCDDFKDLPNDARLEFEGDAGTLFEEYISQVEKSPKELPSTIISEQKESGLPNFKKSRVFGKL